MVPYIGLVIDGTSRPIKGVCPVLSCWASLLGRNWSDWMAASTRASVSGRMRLARPLSTLDTVLTDTVACRATSWMVVIEYSCQRLQAKPVRQPEGERGYQHQHNQRHQ